MKSIQYTIRSVPAKLDAELRSTAHKSGKSLNQVMIEALAKGTGLSNNVEYDDLDWLYNQPTLAKDFDEAIEWLNDAPKELL